MNKPRFVVYATVGTVLYGSGQVIDLATTFLLSPDLALETNILVQRFGFGWAGVILMAVLSTTLMYFTQRWMWRRFFDCLPENRVSYRALYKKLLVTDLKSSSDYQIKSYSIGVLMGVAFIVTYAAIASKYLTIAWNLSIAVTLVDYHPPILVRAIKSAVAATFGMVMFFVFPFCLSRSNNSS